MLAVLTYMCDCSDSEEAQANVTNNLQEFFFLSLSTCGSRVMGQGGTAEVAQSPFPPPQTDNQFVK